MPTKQPTRSEALAEAIEKLIEAKITIAIGNNQAWSATHKTMPEIRQNLVDLLDQLPPETTHQTQEK